MQQQLLLHSSSDYWEERANTILSKFNYKHPDEIDIEDICWKYGVRILPLDKPFVEHHEIDFQTIKHLKAFSIPQNKGRRGVIFLQPEIDHIEKKVVLAEEFCHIYAHHISQLQADKYYLAKTENQAKRMAAYLLMPWKFLKNVLSVATDQAVLITDIADYFLVPEEFAQYRLTLYFRHKVYGFVSYNNQLGSIEWLE